MSKFGGKNRQNPGQLSILDLLKSLSESASKPTPEGQLNLIERLRVALRDAITKEIIDSWTREDQSETRSDGLVGSAVSDSKTIRRHIPAEYLPAFCKVTGSSEPLRLLCEAAGFFVLPGPEALRAEIQKIDEQIRDGQDRKRKRMMFLREMEKQKPDDR